jgi:hypothetical protein
MCVLYEEARRERERERVKQEKDERTAATVGKAVTLTVRRQTDVQLGCRRSMIFKSVRTRTCDRSGFNHLNRLRSVARQAQNKTCTQSAER